jgi:hypothetical protein
VVGRTTKELDIGLSREAIEGSEFAYGQRAVFVEDYWALAVNIN